MKTKTILISFAVAFIVLCGLLVVDSGLFKHDSAWRKGGIIPLASQTTLIADNTGEKNDADKVEAYPTDKNKESNSKFDFSMLRTPQGKHDEIVMGSLDPENVERTDDETKFKFMLELTTKGAAIKTVTLSEFDDRNPDNAQPLELIAPTDTGTRLKYSLANTSFLVTGQGKPFPLDMLEWKIAKDLTTEPDGSQKVVFSAVLGDNARKDAFRFTKTYRLAPGSYDLYCQIEVENLSDTAIEAWMGLQGPGGIVREDSRSDMRKVATAYLVSEGKIEVAKKDFGKIRKYIKSDKPKTREKLNLGHKTAGAHFMWGAVTNKYFSAILRPVPDEGEWPEGIVLGPAQYTDPELKEKRPGKQGNASFTLHMPQLKLAPAQQEGSSKTFTFHLFLGPKDRDVFNKNPEYKKLDYYQTIDFRGCCCPAKLIQVLAFGIMTVMKAMYTAMGPLGNYGVVIMVLVFLVRLIMHPVTKKSQISMMKMQKLGPMMEELKKKYKDKTELNKKVMQLYKEQGVSPLSSFLPMMIQMPIWIALWSAINASFDLRGAAFLPFWITDLSSPDALFRFKEFTIPLLNWHIDSFNLLPLLMGVVMFLQQKLMPHANTAQTNPQVAQQQKMMMIMMPLMFPIMLYKGPSGVNLYIMSSISAGVIEQMIIRKHIREKEEEESRGLVPVTKKTGGKVKKKKPKPFFKT